MTPAKPSHIRNPIGPIGSIGLVGLCYALVVILMTLPTSIHPGRALMGNTVDTWIFYWNNWWIGQAIREGHDWFSTPYLFYAPGKGETSLLTHSHSFLNSLFALTLTPYAGPVAAYNLVILLNLWIGAMGMYLFLKEMTRHPLAAGLGGFIYTFAPYHLSQLLAHANLGAIHWWPFYALYLRRALTSPTQGGRAFRPALLAGAMAALTAWSGIQLALLLAIWTLAYTIWCTWRRLTTIRPASAHQPTALGAHLGRTLGVLSVVACTATILTAPIIIPLAKGWRRTTDQTLLFNEGIRNQTDLLAYLIPPAYHPLVGDWLPSVREHLGQNAEYSPYLGYAVIGLALVSLLPGRGRKREETPGAQSGDPPATGETRKTRERREAPFWSASAVAWIVLAAGGALKSNGTVYTNVPLPYALIGHLFPLSVLRVPDRFNLLTTFSLAVLAGLGADRLLRCRSTGGRGKWGKWKPALIFTAITAMVMLEFMSVPIPTFALPHVSPFLHRLAREEPTYAIVDYPMGYTAGKQWLYYQTIHGKPTVEGHVSRYTFENYAFIASQPVLQAFYQIAEKPHYLAHHPALQGKALPLGELGPALYALNIAGVRYIIVHKTALTTLQRDHFRRTIPLPPMYEDETIAVYETSRPWPVFYDGMPVPLTPDGLLARFDAVKQGATWQVEVMATPRTARRDPLDCRVRLTGAAGTVADRPIALFGAPPGAIWETNVLAAARITITVPPTPEAGAYHWRLTCAENGDYTAPDTWEVYPDGHSTYLRRRTDVRFGDWDSIALEGYRWRTEGADLHITLQWKALRPPGDDYKVFIHLLDPDDRLVAQYDAVPCQWSCPTGQWHSGDVILDRGSIPLGTLPPGRYRLAVGLYAPEDGTQPLPAHGPEGAKIVAGRFYLPDPFVILTDIEIENGNGNGNENEGRGGGR